MDLSDDEQASIRAHMKNVSGQIEVKTAMFGIPGVGKQSIVYWVRRFSYTVMVDLF